MAGGARAEGARDREAHVVLAAEVFQLFRETGRPSAAVSSGEGGPETERGSGAPPQRVPADCAASPQRVSRNSAGPAPRFERLSFRRDGARPLRVEAALLVARRRETAVEPADSPADTVEAALAWVHELSLYLARDGRILAALRLDPPATPGGPSGRPVHAAAEVSSVEDLAGLLAAHDPARAFPWPDALEHPRRAALAQRLRRDFDGLVAEVLGTLRGTAHTDTGETP
jgi:hypothetical protein